MQIETQKKTEKDQKIGQIMGINIISSSTSWLLARVKKNLTHNIHFYIVTPNPELVLMAQGNSGLKKALNESDLPIPDGIGLAQASKFLSFKRQNVVFTFFQGLYIGMTTIINSKNVTSQLPIHKGREIFFDLIRLSDKNKFKVFLLGGEKGEGGLAASELTKKYKNIKILSDSGPNLDKSGEPAKEFDRKLERDAVDKINKFAPDLLFVAFGNPKQEIWINKNIDRLRIGGAMCVGGTFRYVSGMSKLPPKWMEKSGLEWVWRLITEPWRVKRIFNAWPIFPWKVFLYKLNN